MRYGFVIVTVAVKRLLFVSTTAMLTGRPAAGMPVQSAATVAENVLPLAVTVVGLTTTEANDDVIV